MQELIVRYSRQRALRWLSQLAEGMQHHGQTIFLIEQLQPTWLGSRTWLAAYQLMTRFGDSLVASFAVLLVLFATFDSSSSLSEMKWNLFYTMLFPAIAAATASALGLLVLDLRVFTSKASAVAPYRLPSNNSRWRRWLRAVRDVTIAVVVAEASLIAFLELRQTSAFGNEPTNWHMALLFSGPALVVGLTRRLVLRSSYGVKVVDVSPIETLVWSWRGFIKGVSAGLFMGIVLAVGWALLVAALGEAAGILTIVLVMTGFMSSIALVVVVALYRAFRVGVFEMRVTPNQGIRSSFFNSLSIARKTLLLSVLVYLGLHYLFHSHAATEQLEVVLVCASAVGLGLALLAGHWYGGAEVLRHSVLRILLSAQRRLPLRVGSFLDYAVTDLHILERVGGGYIFLHRHLLEYFAELATSGGAPAGGGHRQPAALAAGYTQST